MSPSPSALEAARQRIVIRNYRYRLYPNRRTAAELTRTLETCRELYNMCLEQRRYQRIGWAEQARQFTDLRAAYSEFGSVNSHTLREVLRRADHAFKAFFRRVKIGKAGYPRFKSRDRFDSFELRPDAFWITGNRLKMSKIGTAKFHLSRAIEGDLRTSTIIRRLGKWYVVFAVECRPQPLLASPDCVGIDVGLEHFAALSTGEFISNPRIAAGLQGRVSKAQRRLSRCKMKSHGRAKAKTAIAKLHDAIANKRLDFLHKESRKLVNRYGLLAVESLNVSALSKGRLAKGILDASWGLFFRLLAYKAADAGREFVKVDPKRTSQTCPSCGHVARKSLSQRLHSCPCGFAAHRDTAAALVVLARAVPVDANVGG